MNTTNSRDISASSLQNASAAEKCHSKAVLNNKYTSVVFFLLGDSLASEFYVLTFWNTLPAPSL